MQLSLVRHAKAEAREPAAADFDRPLDRRGRAEITNMAGRLLARELFPDLILASPAVRALQTAEALVRTLELPGRRLQREERLYLALAPDLLEIVRSVAPPTGHLMLVGHNPGLTELARWLAAPGVLPEELETASIAHLRFAAHSWSELQPGAALEASYDSPQRFFAPRA